MLTHQKAAFASAKKAIRVRAVDLSQSRNIENADSISARPKPARDAGDGGDYGDRTVDGSFNRDESAKFREPGVGGNLENESYHGGKDESSKPLIQDKQVGGAFRAKVASGYDLGGHNPKSSVVDVPDESDDPTTVTTAANFLKKGDREDITNAKEPGHHSRFSRTLEPRSPVEDSEDDISGKDPDEERHAKLGKFRPVQGLKNHKLGKR